MRALVADDETTSRLLLKRMLSKWGYDVIAVEDGRQAWEVLSARDRPRLAVLDWMMPGMDALDICRRLRASNDGGYVYAILVTQHDTDDARSVALDAGADDFVKKPFNPGELQRRLNVGRRVASYDEKLQKYAHEMEDLAQSRAKQLVHADRMATLGVLSAGVAHEVNNPATFISGNVQTVKRFWVDLESALRAGQEHDEETLRKLEFIYEEMPRALDGILDGVKRISKIVKGLKTYAHREMTAKASCNLQDCVSRAVDLLRFQLKTSSISVQVAMPEDLPTVVADAQQIEQILVNLLVNGVHAMEGRRAQELRVDGSYTDDEVTVCVADTGPGIPDKVIQKIWNPFFTTKAVGTGTGLGLSICKGIAEDHGGKLTGENREEGGAIFRLTIPRK